MGWLLLTLVGVVLSPASSNGQKLDPASLETGAYLYRAHCAVCHGKTGEGDGPLSEQLRALPADLTRVAARNGGRWSFEDVARTIDGRNPLRGHGGPEMPIWGDAFKERAEGFSEQKARQRIDKLVRYLESIQRK